MMMYGVASNVNTEQKEIAGANVNINKYTILEVDIAIARFSNNCSMCSRGFDIM